MLQSLERSVLKMLRVRSVVQTEYGHRCITDCDDGEEGSDERKVFICNG